jgi:hypothetical protein
MSMQVSLTGADTVIIGGQIITDFATGIVGELKFPNDIVQVQRGKNGNTIYALNNTGFQSEVTIRILLGYSNDSFINAQMVNQKANFAGFTLLNGIFVKNVGDGNGNIHPVTYIMSGGVIKRQPDQKSVAEGDPTQSLVEWSLIFGNNDRQIG